MRSEYSTKMLLMEMAVGASVTVLLFGCGDAVDSVRTEETRTEGTESSPSGANSKADWFEEGQAPLEARDGDCEYGGEREDPDCFLRVASWNIQNFSVNKAADDRVMDRIAEKLIQFDVVAVQEVMNVREQADPNCPRNADCPEADNCGVLREALDSRLNGEYGRNYGFAFSPQVRHERYLYIYNRNRVELLEHRLVDDPGDSEPVCAHRPEETGAMVRQPHLAAFQAGDFSFTLLNTHVSTTETAAEIEALLEFQRTVRDEGYSDVVVLGDLNADCSYLSQRAHDELPDQEFLWLFEEVDTTLYEDSACAYDRFLITAPTIEDLTGERGRVKNVDLEMSDHYPIWMNFFLDRDSDSHAEDLPIR